MYDGLARGLLLVGALLIMLTTAANSYHSKRFQRHTDRLEQHRRNEDYRAIEREVEDFATDRRLEAATKLLLLEPVAFFLLVVGVALLLA